MHLLLETIARHIPLTPADEELCRSTFEPVSVGKGQRLEEQGRIPRHLYFVAQGFVRAFYHDEQGAEVTTNLSGPGAFVTSFLSFIHESPAPENLEAVTEGELYRVERPALAALIARSENFKQFSLIIFEQAIAATQARANDLATLKAEQRYEKLLATQPGLLQHVPVQYIASYLGMQPESLSRIRRQRN